MGPKLGERLANLLALNRTVAVVLASVLLFGLGEQLWSDFMPELLRVRSWGGQRTSGDLPLDILLLVGTYTFLRNLFEAFCYIGGGTVTARLGDRGSLLLFGVLTILGYSLFLLGTATWMAVLAALLILGWEPLSVPVTFTTVGSTVSERGRGMAFALQSIQKRLPKIIGPFVGGLLLGWARQTWGEDAGQVRGMSILVGTALALGMLSLAVQLRFMPHRPAPPPGPPAIAIVRSFHPILRGLWLAEVCTRWCDWLVRDFVVLYLLLVENVPIAEVGALIALQHFTALLTYLPIGQLTRSRGLRPFIGLTFIFFALFPLALAIAPGGYWLIPVFIIYGLREIGEPARKALITSLIPGEVRARGVGLYWGLRFFATCWSALVGAVIWHLWGPQVLLLTAFAMGCIGAAVYYFLCPSDA
ncbi:MAG: MFS transporter [Planctomycetes bacterium]|nr:MFS transporter [Planctomycetota bacterium]